MRLMVYVPLLAWVLLGPTSPALARRLRPAAAGWWLAGLAVTFTALSWGALGLLALDGTLLMPAVSRLGDFTPGALRPLAPVGPVVAAAAGLLLAASSLSAAVAVTRRIHALRAAGRMARSLPGAGLVALVEDSAPAAFAVPGRRCRVVVSSGMADALSAGEYAALLAHERAHLAHRHHLFLAVTGVAAVANPLLRPTAGATAHALERWADEQAAAATGDRAGTAAAIGHAALASTAARGPHAFTPALLAIGGARCDRRPGPVPRRVAALLAPPPRSGRLVAPVLAAVAVAVAAGALHAALDLHGAVEIAQAVTHTAHQTAGHRRA